LIEGHGHDKESSMSRQKRILLALGIILVDLVVFFVPLTAFFLAYVIVYNPPWARDFLEGLDRGAD
jgi:uncharacterized membrane protein